MALRATHLADNHYMTGEQKIDSNSRAICNHRLGLSIGRRRSLQPLLTLDKAKVTCERCRAMAPATVEV